MTKLVQLQGPSGRRIAVVEEPNLRLLDGFSTIYELASDCLQSAVPLETAIESRKSSALVTYDDVYNGGSSWRLKASADQPAEPSRCLVSGTGLTHQASAKNRDAMHAGTQ